MLYALLGALIGIAAAGFIRGLSFAEDTFERIRNPYLRNFVGMLSIGVMIYAFMVGAGHYFVEGVGYSTVQAILAGGLDLPELLILLFAAKLAATSISLGAGSSGGSFSPSLFMGATLGAAFGVLVEAVHPMESFGTTTCAVIGMAAMVGGGTGAAMTAVTMIFEMTRDYDLMMPSIIAVALAIGVRRLLSIETIYTVKLVGRGHFVPKALLCQHVPGAPRPRCHAKGHFQALPRIAWHRTQSQIKATYPHSIEISCRLALPGLAFKRMHLYLSRYG